MKKTAAILPLFCLLLSTSYASDWKSRFDFTAKSKPETYKASQLEFKPYHFDEVSVDEYNKGVELSNNSLDAMNSGDFEQAINGLKAAVSIAPAAVNFRKNYIIALNNSHKHPEDLIKEADILLGMDPDIHEAAYMAGLAYLNDIQDFEKAADYLSYALKRDPQNLKYISALITTLENTGKYSDSVFELCQKYAKKINKSDIYYILGRRYLDKQDYSKAISSFSTAKKLAAKDESRAHYRFINASFLGGHMAGLLEETKRTLYNYPDNEQANSVKKIYNALAETKYTFTDRVIFKINGASGLKSLQCIIRPVKDFYNHQKVNLTTTEIVSRNKRYPAEVVDNPDGSITINIPMNLICPQITLELKYNVTMNSLCNFYLEDSSNPEISDYTNDKMFSLDDNRVEQLANYIDNLKLTNKDANSAEEEFVTKAAMAIAKGLVYKENGIDNSVSWALDNMDSCDCTEYSRLLVALCLKKNIPAKLATGFLIKPENLSKDTSIGHEWCEVYIKGRGWTTIDPTLQTTMGFAYFGNLLSDQLFFEYPNQYEKTRIGIEYSATNPDVSIDLTPSYRITTK